LDRVRTPEETATAFWSLDLPDLADQLKSGPEGLTAREAADRLVTLGPNTVEDRNQTGPFRILLRQFESPLVLILVFAAVVSLSLQQWIDAAIVLVIVLGSALLSFSQEYRASTAVAALRQKIALTCRVLRGGVEEEVQISQIVPGDVVILTAGNLIPADGLIMTAADFLVSQAAMTGETFPVEKRPGIVPADSSLAARTNAVFLGASVQSGTARVLVAQTGRQTAFGAIAARLHARPPETEFGRGVRQFGVLLVRVMIVIVVFVLVVNLTLGRPVTDSLLFAVALAVGISPELLPAIISVTLSAGARAMSKRGVIVRRLDAIENLGSMDVLCTDKTGTLTQGVMTLDGAVDAEDRATAEVLELGFLNGAFQNGITNPLDTALVAAGQKAGLVTTGHVKIDEIPYDFVRRRLTIVTAPADSPGQHLILTKGAFSNVLETCTAFVRDGVEVPLDKAGRAALTNVFEAKGRLGLRVLAVASARLLARPEYDREDEKGLTFRGFLLFADPPKVDARQTLADLSRLGIAVKIISGDNRYVTAHVAQSVGMDPTSILTGDDLNRLGDDALWHLAPKTTLFAEIDPQQKERIVRALQRMGHAVGYLGDGINDAPALHAADVGISVDGAVDVARESADIILMNHDLGVLRNGVEDGRKTFVNTLKYINITTSANFGNMVSMALVAPFLPFLPLLAKQILLNNFLSDLPSIAISSDNVDPERVTTPQRWNIADIRRFMLVFGLLSSVFDLVTFAALYKVFHAGEAPFQTAWFIISLLTELFVVLILRTRRPVTRSMPGRLLMWSTVAVVLATFAVPFLGPVSRIFGFVPLSVTEMATVIAILAGYVLANEFAKRWFFGAGRTSG
jgi:P-type Mg2+ transporter